MDEGGGEGGALGVPTRARAAESTPAPPASVEGPTGGQDGSPAAGRARGPTVAGRPLARAALLALPCAVLLERAWSHRWMTDDGFINLRVVDMILGGHGPVFNVGERVEVTTSPLWVWALAAGDVLLPLRLEWVAVLMGLAGAVAGLGLATAGAVRLHRPEGATGLVVPAGAAVLAAVPPVWDFSTSGLEGGLTFAWLGLVAFVLARWARREATFGSASAAVVGLGPLVRPDLALVTMSVLAAVLLAQWAGDGWGARLRLLGAAAAVPLAYQAFRMGYYAAVVPNTALAKAGGRSRWGTGVDYLRDLADPYLLAIPVVALLAGALVPAVARAWSTEARRVAAALVALPVGGVLYGAYVVRVGGDYMHGRLLLPALFALLAPVAAVPVVPGWLGRGAGRPAAGRYLRGAAVGAVVLSLAWSIACLTTLRRDTASVPGLFVSDARAGNVASFGPHAVTAADQGWGPDDARPELARGTVVVADREVAVDPPGDLPTPAYASFGIGVAGYVYGPDVHLIDMLGLADPVTARFELARPGLTGHEKPVPPAWLAARISTGPVDPDALPHPVFGRPLWDSPDDRLDADAEAARAALHCGDLSDLAGATRDRLTPSRFVANILDAPRLTALTVPPNPTAARQRFCDG